MLTLHSVSTVWTVSLALVAGSAWAADPITEAVNAAYGPYRAALFRTNGQSQPESLKAIGEAQAAWKKLTDQWGRKPSLPYSRDPGFARTLQEVAQVYAKAEQQIMANELSTAHETLERARDLMAEMRRRNGVITYSDHMNSYHSAMERALVDGPKWLVATPDWMSLAAQVGVLEHLARMLRTEAPTPITTQTDFSALMADVDASVQALKQAVWTQDAEQAKSAIGKLKGPYSKLFLRFG